MGKWSNKWTAEHLEKVTGQKPEPHSRAVKIPKSDPKGLQYIKNWLKVEKVIYQEELVFHPERNFRFDVAMPELKLAVEYEGLMSERSRHTTVAGYSKDCEKYNIAQLAGWTVLRYTAMNYEGFPDDYRFMIEQ